MITTLLLAGITVTFPMEARVHGTEVTLDELAAISGENPEDIARVGAVELGYAPMPGYSRLFFAVRVAQVVERKTGITIEIAGDRACRAWPVEEEIAGTSIMEAARGELEHLTEKLDAEYVPNATVQSISVPAGAESAVLEAYYDKPELQSGMLNIPVRLIVDGQIYRTIWTSWKVSVFEERTVLRRGVVAGERLGLDHFKKKRVLVPRVSGMNPLGRGMVVGAVAARDLSADQMVTNLDVHRPLLIRRGDSIFLQVRKGGITARVPAVAREDGALGDRIVIATAEGERQMGGVVLSRDIVEVDLGSKKQNRRQ